MFSDMNDLELGSCLGPSDLLFPDDLFNVPLDHLSGYGFNDEDDIAAEKKKLQQHQDAKDVLQMVMDEVKVEEETTETVTASSPAWLETTVDVDSLLMDSPASIEEDDANDTQSLIEEMEIFLEKHENNDNGRDSGFNSLDTSHMDVSPATNAPEVMNADQLLQALIKGNVEQTMSTGNVAQEVNNVSEIVTDDGENIIIVVTSDMASPKEVSVPTPPPSCVSALSPACSSSTLDDDCYEDGNSNSDSEWQPDTPPSSVASAGGRRRRNATTSSGAVRKRERKPAVTTGVRDRRERKKLQNVVAARRYRDKKKSEQMEAEEEEQKELERHQKLMTKLKEKESELKTLKNLMVELGLVTVASK